jgi:uncharacterized protein
VPKWSGAWRPFIFSDMTGLSDGSATGGGTRLLLGLCLVAGATAAFDAFLVEPNWIEVRRSVEYLPVIRVSAPDLTIAHLSDLHIGRLGARELRAIEIVNSEQPDLIVISGDLSRRGKHPRDIEAFLSALRARRGKFLVWGNHDHRGRMASTWGPDLVRRAGFTLLQNSSRRIAYPGGRLYIAGVDDPVTGRDNLHLALERVPRRDVCILLAHSPEVVRNLGNWDIDFVLAGHTHGGQVRLPFIGALWVPFGTRDYPDGWFDVDRGVRLHVSRGLGWTGIPIRFFCRPRIDLIVLRGGVPPGRRVSRTVVGRS